MKCSAHGCKSEGIARNLCRRHYQAAWKAKTLISHETATRPALADRLLAKIDKATKTGCWKWTGGLNDSGYGVILMGGKNGGRQERAHRLSFVLLGGGTLYPGDVICHTCDVRSCVNPAHLFVGTRTINNEDMARKGRAEHSEMHHAAKLTNRQVKYIRNSSGIPQTELARLYGVTQSVISRIRTGKAWLRI